MQSIFRRTPSTRRKESRRVSMGQLSGATALHDAVAKGKVHLARFILEALDGEGPANSRDKHGKTPLFRAVRIENNHLRSKIINLLIKHGGDVNAQDNMGRTPLSYACELFYNDVVLLLVKNNVDPNIEDNNGNTPLMYCSIFGNAEAIEIITKSFRRLGLEVDKMNADGLTPLMMAAKKNNVRCASCLIQEGRASIDQKDLVHNMTTIEWAKESGWSLHEMSILQKRARRTSKIDQVSSGVSSNESSTEQISSLPKVPQQKSDIRNYLTVSQDLGSRGRSHSAPRETESTEHDSHCDLSRQRLFEVDGKRASLPEFILSSSVQYREASHESIQIAVKACANGMFVKRTAKTQGKTRPFSGRSRPTRQSKSFDSAIGRDSSSLEDLCDRSDEDIHGNKQKKYLLSADPKQLISMVPLSRSSDALPSYRKISKVYIGSGSSDSSEADLVSTGEIEPVTIPAKEDRGSKTQLPPLK